MLKHASLTILASLIFGCSSVYVGSGSDPFDSDFKPIAYNKQLSGSDAFSKGVDLLRREGLNVAPNETFLTAISETKPLGIQRWLQNNDKWNLSYQVGFQIIDSKGGQVFWRITYRITGTRSGSSPRTFTPSEFKITQDIFSDLERKMSSLFSVRA